MRLIDADALIEKTDCLFKDLNSTEDYMGIGYNHGVGDCIAITKNAPTIEAEPVKRGRWIIKDDSYTYGIIRAVHWYECSNCGGIAHVEYPYCPHCGAKMEERREDGDGDG